MRAQTYTTHNNCFIFRVVKRKEKCVDHMELSVQAVSTLRLIMWTTPEINERSAQRRNHGMWNARNRMHGAGCNTGV